MDIKYATTLGAEILKRISEDDIHKFVNEIIKPDKTLAKLFRFSFEPVIENDFETYPVDPKIQELKNIDDTDWTSFFDKFYNSEGLNKECFRFFKLRLQSTYSCISHLAKFPQSKIPLQTIYSYTSFNSFTELIDSNGEQKLWISIGKYWPYLWIDYINRQDGDIIECFVDWLMREPKEKELKEIEPDEWDKHSFKLYQQLGEEFNEILAGLNLSGADKASTKFRLYYLFQGEKLNLAKRGYFEFPIVHRYKPLIITTAKGLKEIEKWNDFGFQFERKKSSKDSYYNQLNFKGYIWEVEKRVLDLAKEYEDKPQYPNPRGYLDAKLRGIDGGQFKKLFTQNRIFLKDEGKPRLRSFVERDGGELDEEIQGSRGETSSDKEIRKSELTEDRTFEGEVTFFGNYFEREKTQEQLLDLLIPRLNSKEIQLIKCMKYMTENQNDKLTQDSLAQKLGKDRSTVSKMIKGIRSKLKEICDEEGISTGDIFGIF